jgi:hypothetical protein
LLQFSSPKQFKTESGVASFLIPKKTVQNTKKTIQNGIKGLFHFSSPKVFIYKMTLQSNKPKEKKCMNAMDKK